MALNFPNSPYNGQVYTNPTSNSRYVYDSTKGKWVSGQYVAVSAIDTSEIFDKANSAFLVANAAFSFQNVDYQVTNTAFSIANLAFDTANAAFGSANNVGPQIAPTYNTANAAYNQANAAYNGSNSNYVTTNAAYNFANTRFSSSGGTISGAVEITADLTVHGNTTFVDQRTLKVGDPLIYLAANNYSSDVVDIGFVANYVNSTSSNVHTGLFRSSGTKEYYLFYGYDQEPDNNYINPTGNNIQMAVLNSTVRTSNLILGGANAINWIGAAYNEANAVYATANAAYNQDNVVFGVANAAYGKANTGLQNTSMTIAGDIKIAGNFAVNNFIEFDTTIGYNYTITTGRNAFTAGPVSIANGNTVTIPSGSYWTVT